MQKAVDPLDSILTPDTGARRRCGPSTEDVRRLALAIAVPGKKARLIEPDNSAGSLVRLHDAVDSGQAFLVTLRDDIVAFDFDDPAHTLLIAEVAQEIRRAGAQPVIWNSGRPDHQHVLGRVGPEERARIEALVAERSGTKQIARRSVRPPLSPHRNGLAVSLVEPDSVGEAALRLRDPNLDDVVPRHPTRLSPEMGRLLRAGERKVGDTSPSGVVQSLLVAMVNAHWNRDRAFKVLAKRENKGGASLQQRLADEGERAAHRWFDLCWRRAEEFVRDNPSWSGRHDAVEALADAKATVGLAVWEGSEGQKVKAVLTAVLDVALSRGAVEVQVSVRQIAEGAGLSRDSVMVKYLPALQNKRLLTKVKKHQGKGSTTYRINLKAIRSLPLSIYPAGREISGGQLSADDDAFRQGGGLGKAGHAILEALVETGTPSDVSERTNLPLSSVRRLLGLMRTGGLVTEVNGVWGRREPLEALQGALATFAYEAGVSTVGERQRLFHKDERTVRDAARSGRKTIPGPTLQPMRGWVAVKGRQFWPLGRPVAPEDLPAEGLVGPILILVTDDHEGVERHRVLSLKRLVDVRLTLPDTATG